MRALPRVAAALLFTGALIVARAPADVSAHDYVRNGSFETGADPWELRTAGALTVVDATAVSPADGAHAAELTIGDTGTTFIRQGIGLLAPGDYDVTARVRAPHGVSVTLRITAAALADGGEWSASDIGDAWSTLGGRAALSAYADAQLAIYVRGPAGAHAYIDAVRMDGAAPTSMQPTSTPTRTPVPGPEQLTPSATKSVSPTHTPTSTATAQPVLPLAVDGLHNGGFEDLASDGGFVAWETYGGYASAATSPVHGGGRAARFESDTDSTKWLHQAVRITPGAGYAFSAWIWNDDARIAGAWLRVSWYGSDDASGTAIGTADSITRLDTPAAAWRELTTAGIAAPASAHSARVRVMLAPSASARSVIYVDDARFGRATVDAPTASSPAAVSNDEAAAAAPSADGRRSSSVRGSSGSVARLAGEAAPPGARVVINEVLYDPDTVDPGVDGEWVELYNAGDEPVDLGGWLIGDNARSTMLPAHWLDSGHYVIVAASDWFSDAYPEYSGPPVVLNGRIGNRLGNDGDRLALADPSGRIVDALSWGDDTSIFAPAVDDVPSGHSIERRLPGADTDTSGDFVDNISPSPGAPFDSDAGNPKQQETRRIELIRPAASRWSWVPWAAAATSLAALAVVGGLRLYPFIRRTVDRTG